MTSQRKLDTVGTWSTIQKRVKRMPDIIVETTDSLPPYISKLFDPPKITADANRN